MTFVSPSPDSWLDFSANIRPGGPPEWARVALSAALTEVAYYPDPAMTREREGLSEYLGLDPAFVLPAAGGVSALDLALCVPAGDVLLATPCFSEYERLARKHGKHIHTASLLRGKHELHPLAAVFGNDLPEGCIVCLANPVNPLGAAFGRADVEALLARVEDAHGWLIVDEAFADYCPECSVRGLVPEHTRLLVAGSMTKVLGVPGVRLGTLCARPEVLGRLSECQLAWELNCFAAAIARALPGGAGDIRAEAERNAARREAMRKSLEALGAFAYPSAASFLLVDLLQPAAPVAAGLKARGMLVRECLDFEGIDDGRHLRLGVKDEAQNARLLKALGEELTCAGNR